MPVSARVGSAGPCTTSELLNDLPAAKHCALVTGEELNVVAHLLQLLNDFRSNPILEVHLRADIAELLTVFGHIGRDAESRAVERGLGVEVVVKHVEKDLNMSLRLHEAAHDTIDCQRERDDQLSGKAAKRVNMRERTHEKVASFLIASRHQRGDDSVVRSLIRLSGAESASSLPAGLIL